MKNSKYILLFIAALMQVSSAQEVFNTIRPGEQRAYFNFEMDPTFAIAAGYAQSCELQAIDRNVTLTADITLPIFLVDLKHYRIKIGTRVPLLGSKNWNIINRFNIKNKGTDNIVYTGNVWSIEEGLLLGYFAGKWFVAGEVDYDKFLFTHLKHSNWYKENVYADAKDGWYTGTGGNIKLGMQAGYTFRNKIELSLGFGLSKTESLNDPVGLPFFMTIGFIYHI